MGIGMVVLLLAVSSLDSAGKGYGRNTDGITSEREARASLTQIGEDLSRAVWHRDTLVKHEGEDRALDQLGFLMLQPDDAQSDDERIGDLCATVYYVADLDTGGRMVRCLMRGFRNSQATFEAVKEGNVASLFGKTDADEPVAFGVLSFGVTPLRRMESGEWHDMEEGEMSSGTTQPEAFRLKLLLARRELAAKLMRSEDWEQSRLIPDSEHVEESNQVEFYEVIQNFAHPS